MKDVTLKDIEDIIENTDIKILITTSIKDINRINTIPVDWYGIYIIYLKSKESYIGMSEGTGIKNRLYSHIHETWHRNIIEHIDIFVTEECYAFTLEKMLIRKFSPELNTIKYDNCSQNKYMPPEQNEPLQKHQLPTQEELEIRIKNIKNEKEIQKQKDAEIDKIDNCEIEKELVLKLSHSVKDGTINNEEANEIARAFWINKGVFGTTKKEIRRNLRYQDFVLNYDMITDDQIKSEFNRCREYEQDEKERREHVKLEEERLQRVRQNHFQKHGKFYDESINWGRPLQEANMLTQI